VSPLPRTGYRSPDGAGRRTLLLLPECGDSPRVNRPPGLAGDRVPVCGLYRVERQFWVTAHFKKVRQPVLYRRLAWWLAESGDRAEPLEIAFEGWEGVAELRSGT